MAGWVAYAINPIDFGWEMLRTVEATAARMAKLAAVDVVHCGDTYGHDLDKFLSDFQVARQMAKAKGWEGDYRSGSEPRVFWLPGNAESFSYAFVWKHDNNGDTFVISPYPLAWLQDNA